MNTEHAELVLSHCEYVDALKKHDWSFEYSDCGRTYRKGYESRARILEMQRRLDPEFRIWNLNCPERYRSGRV